MFFKQIFVTRNDLYDTTCVTQIGFQILIAFIHHTSFSYRAHKSCFTEYSAFKQNDSRKSCISSNYCTNFREKQVKEKETKKSVCDKSSLKRRKNLGFYETLLAECG